ncbi:VPLPA-CTERM sorting domain-containing protein [Dinoroseobacter sp. S76]|uniref:VPLPA-CTERM sorting domain-containing protein n=1 Tax=Dinoroseobacter sp. S76 TaxID=3415124 RepID=UPI003C7A19E3
MKALTLALFLSALTPGLAAADTLFFDDFESNTAGPNRTPSGWSTTSGAVDITGTGYFPDVCYNIDTCVDLDGSIGAAGTIQTQQSFTLVDGVKYTLSFDYSKNYFQQQNTNVMTFGVGGISDTLSVPGGPRADDFAELSFSFMGDGSTGSIFFAHEGGDNGGIIIDNVKLVGGTASPSPVPLPASLPLLAGGLLGAAALRRRKSVKS